MEKPITFDVFTDFICPWCYLATVRIERLRQAYNIDVQYHFFPLHPETPPEGLTLEALFDGRNIDIEKSQEEISARMAEEGLPYARRTMTYNSRMAQELAKWAATQDRGEVFISAVYRAYFVENRNLAKVDVLKEIAQSAGLSPTEAGDVLESRAFREAVDEDWNRCRQLGLTGVPAFAAGGSGVMGAQPYEVLEQLVIRAGAQKRNESH